MNDSREGREGPRAAEGGARGAASRPAFEFERLEHELAAIRSLLENAVQGMAELDAGGRYLRVNQAYAAALGYAPGDLADLHWHETIAAEDVECARSAYQQAREDGTAEFEARGVRRDGSHLHMQIIMTRVLDSGQRFQGHFCFLRDVSERKNAEDVLRQANEQLELRVAERTLAISEANERLQQEIAERERAEAALRAREEQYRTIVADHADLIVRWFPDGTRTYVNEVCSSYFGRRPEELVGASVLDDILEQDRGVFLERLSVLTPQAPVSSGEHRVRRAGGGVAWTHWTDRAIFDGTGQVCEFQSVGRDITEQKQTEQQLRFQAQLLDAVRESIVATDLEGRVVYWGRGAQQLYGYAVDEVLGRKLEAFLADAENAPEERERMGTALRTGRWSGERTLRRKDGTMLVAETVISLVSDAQGEPCALVGIDRDITDRKQAGEALRRSEERYRNLYDDNPSMFFTVDDSGCILSVNTFGAEQLGYTVSELVGQSLAVLDHGEDRTAVQRLKAILRQPGKLHRCEECMARKDGSPIWLRVTARVAVDAQQGAAVLIVCEDITESHKLSEQLSYQATHDTLTGLVNRREFEHRLQRVLETAQQDPSDHALCYMDLDQFKIINDTCGHVAGDTLLRQLGELLQEQVRKRDTVARLGGDEFGILMEHCNLAQAWRAADAVRRVVDSYRFLWEDKAFNVGASIGLVPLNERSGSSTEVLRDADTACYAAKDRGRNRIQVYRQGDTELSRRHGEMQWAACLSRALEQDRFVLSAQPITRVADDPEPGAHYEVMVHLQDEDGNLIAPSTFLAAAERYNLSVKIDFWVIRRVLSWLAAHPKHLDRLHMCCINLSGQSLVHEEFLEFLVPQAGDLEIPPERICFQVAESAAVANLAGAARFIKALRALGFSFALDDYGSGLSSFAYLKNLPVDFLKMDASMITEIADDPVALAMVRSINDMAHVLGRATIADGVHCAEVAERLRELGVDYAQGELVGAARPLEALT